MICFWNISLDYKSGYAEIIIHLFFIITPDLNETTLWYNSCLLMPVFQLEIYTLIWAETIKDIGIMHVTYAVAITET